MSCSVYRHMDAEMNTLYIGLSKDVLSRTVSHESTSSWFPLVRHIEVLQFETREIAKRVEQQMIEQHKPRHNIVYLLDQGMHKRERRRVEVGAEHSRLKPLVANLIAQMGEHALARKIGVSGGTLMSFTFGGTVPMPITVSRIADYFRGSQ